MNAGCLSCLCHCCWELWNNCHISQCRRSFSRAVKTNNNHIIRLHCTQCIVVASYHCVWLMFTTASTRKKSEPSKVLFGYELVWTMYQLGGPGSSQGKGEFWEEHLLVHYKVQGISRVSQLSGRWQQQPAFHWFLPRPMATLSWFTGLFSAFLYVITKLLCKWFPSVTANLQQRPSNMTYNVKVNQHLILIITLIMSMVLSSRRKPLREFTRFICQF